MKVALIQLTTSDDPVEMLPVICGYVTDAAQQGARLIVTPEVTNCVSSDRSYLNSVLHNEANDPTLAALRTQARDLGVWILIGSLALKTADADGRFANRSILISPEGEIAARYDKIHMFDVIVSDTERYQESAGYRPGTRAVTARVDETTLGLAICYDLRFPYLFSALAQAGAQILTVPAAFTVPTGRAHWETLLRARAIETGCFVLAAAQTGTHPSLDNTGRKTYGHSLAISPWGEVLADAGTEPGVTVIDLDLGEIARVRARIPALTHHVSFTGPETGAEIGAEIGAEAADERRG